MRRILFVDDDALALTLLQKTCQIYGYDALLANSGREALELAEVETLDLIVVDMRMMDMDGLSLLQALTENPKTQPIPKIMLTAGSGTDIVSEARAAGAVDCLYKPLNFEMLQSILENCDNGTQFITN